jgi:hypothetical protein
VNIVGIELAQPLINAHGLMRTGGISLAVLPAQNLAGFWSLLNGLLDQSGSATRGETARQPARLPVGPVSPSPKGKGERTESTTDSNVAASLLSLVTPRLNAEASAAAQTGEIPPPGLSDQGNSITATSDVQKPSTIPLAQPVALTSLGASNTASAATSPDPPPASMHDVAFGLRLTWQSPGGKTPEIAAPHSRVNAALPFAPEPHPIKVANQMGQSSGLGGLAWQKDIADTREPELSTPHVAPGKSSFSTPSPGEVDPERLSIAALRPIPGLVAGTASTARTGTRYADALVRSRVGNVTASSPPLDHDLSPEVAFNPQNINAPPPESRNAGPAVPGETSYASALRADHQPKTPTKTETQAEALTSPGEGGDALHDSTAPRRQSVAPLTPTASAQGTPSNDMGEPAGTAKSESDLSESKIQITEKVPLIQASNQSSGHGVPGVEMDRVAVSGGTAQAQGKTAPPQPQHSTTLPSELDNLSVIQTQPIREISFRLAAASASVDVQVAQRGGKVQVAVRTADQDLAQSLQTNLGELVGRLEDKGFKAETWAPIAAPHGSAAVREPSNSANSQNQSEHSAYQGGQQDQRQGQRESNQRQQERWKMQFEETLSVPVTTAHEEGEL